MLLIQIISLKHNTEKIIWRQNSYVALTDFLKRRSRDMKPQSKTSQSKNF